MGKPSLWSKGGYQPVSIVTGVPIPPNTGSNVKKEDIKRKWIKMTDNTETLYNALDKIKELEKENTKLNKTNNTLYESVMKVGKRNNELKAQVERLEKEKCELLGLIQSKDELIEKMKCCSTCKYWKYKDIQKYCKKRTGTPELADRFFKCDKWELAE